MVLIFIFLRFKANAEAVSYSYTHRQNPPLETAIYWSEHVAKTGGKLIQSEAVHLPWYIYHSLDVWAFLIACTTVISILMVMLVKRLCSRGAKQKEE